MQFHAHMWKPHMFWMCKIGCKIVIVDLLEEERERGIVRKGEGGVCGSVCVWERERERERESEGERNYG